MLNLLNVNLRRDARLETDEGVPNKRKKSDKTKCRFANSGRADCHLENSLDVAPGDVRRRPAAPSWAPREQ